MHSIRLKSIKIEHNFSLLSLECLLLCLFLILFPIDSSLRMLIGVISPNNYLMLLFIAWVVIFRLYRIRSLKLVDFVFIIYFVHQVLLILFGPDFLNDRNIVFIISFVFGFIVGLINWTDKELSAIRKSFLIGLLPPIIVMFFLSRLEGLYGRLSFVISEEMDQNYLVANLIFGISIALFSMRLCKSLFKRLLYFLLLVVTFISVLYLGSRGGLLGIIAMIVFFLISEYKKKAVVSLTVFVIIVFVFSFFASNLLPDWMSERFSNDSMFNIQSNNRIQIWRDCIQYYNSSDIFHQVFGNGRGAGRYISWNVTHNIYIKSLIDTGLFGLSFMSFFYYKLFSLSKRRGNSIALGALIGFLVCGFFLDLDNYRIFGVLFAFTRLPNLGAVE